MGRARKDPLAFRVVREPAVAPRWWSGMSVPFPLAAAAALVLGATLGMARLDVQYDSARVPCPHRLGAWRCGRRGGGDAGGGDRSDGVGRRRIAGD